MKILAKIAVIALTATNLAGCNQGPSLEDRAAIRQGSELNLAMARERKISYAEAARRDNALIEQTARAHLSDNDRLLMALHLALFAEVDAGRMTPELANLKYEERRMQMNEAALDRQAQISSALITAGAAMAQPPRQPLNCTSSQVGGFTNTHCN